MATIGSITVPTPPTASAFPLSPDNGSGSVEERPVIVHRFGSANGLIEQRFIMGAGRRTFNLLFERLRPSQQATLKSHFQSAQGIIGNFNYAAPNISGTGTTTYVCRYRDPQLKLDAVSSSLVRAEIALLEVPQDVPAYSVLTTLTRFPNGTLNTALTGQTHELIPLLKIIVGNGYPDIFLSDRDLDLTVGAVTTRWNARLVKYSEITQTISSAGDGGGAQDSVHFTLGNADRVMSAVANDVYLDYARVEFSLFHVGTQIKLDLWAGNIVDWSLDAGVEFTINCSDPASALGLVVPPRRVSRKCWKKFNDGTNCPYATEGTLHTSRTLDYYDTTKSFTFTPSATECDKSFDGTNGCLSHEMERFYGGHFTYSKAVTTKDNSTGFSGFGRGSLTTVSQLSDTPSGKTLPLIFCDYSDNPDVSVGLKVDCLIYSGREEGDFYVALGIVGQGPISEYAKGTIDYCPAKLDGQPYHGWPQNEYGLRRFNGFDPTGPAGVIFENNFFSLSESFNGVSKHGIELAAGTAFSEVRRKDEKGLQPTGVDSHTMQETIRKGLWGYKWTGLSTRVQVEGMTNLFWVVANVWFFAWNAYQNTPAAIQAALIDVQSFIDAGAIADLTVPKIIGTGTETQFRYMGTINQERPVRDVFQEILNCGLGYFTWSFGKLRVGTRINSSVIGAYNSGNMLYGSLKLQPRRPDFNYLTGSFPDSDFNGEGNSVEDYSEPHALFIGRNGQPRYMKASLNYPGIPTKSQGARVVTTRLREEVGGVGVNALDEMAAARNFVFGTTILGLEQEAGQVVSVGDADTIIDLPTYPATDPANPDSQAAKAHYIEGRIDRWTLSPDMSVLIEGRTTHNDVYQLAVGPKPKDVDAYQPPEDPRFIPNGFMWVAETKGDGKVTFKNFQISGPSRGLKLAGFEIFYEDEANRSFEWDFGTSGALDAVQTTMLAVSPHPPIGSYLQVGLEMVQIVEYLYTGPNISSYRILRGQLGTTAVVELDIGPIAVISKSATNALEFYLPSGLAITPGDNLLMLTGGVQTGFISSYDAATGRTTTAVPLSSIDPGDIVTVFHQRKRVSIRKENITFPTEFFTGGGGADFTYTFDLPSAGLLRIRAYLESTQGVQSDWFYVDLTDARTGNGNEPITMFMPNLPPQVLFNDAFEPVKIAKSESFLRTWVELSTDAISPIVAPREVSIGVPDSSPETAKFILGGTVAATNSLGIAINLASGVILAPYTWYAADHGITGANSLSDVAVSIAAALNADELFATYYHSEPFSNSVVIFDLTGLGVYGTITLTPGGSLTATTAGLSAPLGVSIGRSYSITYKDSADTYFTELSPASQLSAPAGGAERINIIDIPFTTDIRVDSVVVYAYPDGQRGGVPRLVGLMANDTGGGTGTFYDTITETALGSAALFPGVAQPSRGGDTTIQAFKDGKLWYQLYIADQASRSEIMDGRALKQVTAGSKISFNLATTGNFIADVRIHLE